MPTDDIALFHSIYRTSIKGREDIVKMMFKFNDDKNGDSVEGKIDDMYTSRVAEIFNVIFKSLSLKIDFVDEDDELRGYDDQNIKVHTLGDQTILCTDYDFFLMNRVEEIKKEILKENLIMSEEELKKEVDRRLREKKFINGSFYDDDGNLLYK